MQLLALKRRTWKSIPSDMWRGHLIKQGQTDFEFNKITASLSYSLCRRSGTAKPQEAGSPFGSWHLSARGDEISNTLKWTGDK